MPEGTATTLQCPTCGEGTTLVAVDRNGVVVDACPRCRGVWLDRGELDKLIDLEASASADFMDEVRGGRERPDRYEDEDARGGHHGSGHGSGHGLGRGSKRRRKRGSFLGEFLDFG